MTRLGAKYYEKQVVALNAACKIININSGHLMSWLFKMFSTLRSLKRAKRNESIFTRQKRSLKFETSGV